MLASSAAARADDSGAHGEPCGIGTAQARRGTVSSAHGTLAEQEGGGDAYGQRETRRAQYGWWHWGGHGSCLLL